MKLPYDRDWYPVKHTFKGKTIKPSQVGECFKLTDWKKDKIFKIDHIDTLTNLYFRDSGPDKHTNQCRVTENLSIESTRKPVDTRNYCITEYYNSMENMFDTHMTSVMEQYKGKFTVLSSGGIDSHMMATWMYKNKMDFNIVGLVDTPRQNNKSIERVQLSIREWSKIVPAKIMRVNKDLVINDYITNKFHASVPKPTINHLDGYDFRTLETIREGSDWILHGGGSNHTMLHNAEGSLAAFNSIDTKWNLFRHTEIFKSLSYPDIVSTAYNNDKDTSPLTEDDRYANTQWNDKQIRWLDFGCWIAYSRLYEDSDDKILTLKNKDWSDLWESIDWKKIDIDLLHDCLNATVWRNYISRYANDDIEGITKTTNTASGLYTPDNTNEQYCRNAWKDLKHRFKGNLPILSEILSCEWLLNRYKKIHPLGLALCQLHSFLQRGIST